MAFDDAKSTTPFERSIEARAKEKMGEGGTKMGLFISTLFSNLPYMMLCCIPLFACVLKVLYIRRRLFYIDHLIYALHIHAFFYTAIMLIVLATIGLNRFAPGAVAGLADRVPMDRVCDANFLVNPLRLSPGLVLQYF